MQGQSDHILVEATGGIRLVTLNRPDDRNAASTAMLFALSELAESLAHDAEARVVILTGAGRAFSAGGDFQHFVRSTQDPELAETTLENSRRLIRAMLDLPIPAIAAVNGAAVGFGATLAALCDIVLVADTAFFAEPHVNVGLVIGDGISVTWPLFMSLPKAKEYVLTGDRIPAEAAVACGLANRVVPHEALLAEARTLAAKLEAQPAHALRDSKALLNLYHRNAVELVLQQVIDRQLEATASPQHVQIVQGLVDRQRRNSRTD